MINWTADALSTLATIRNPLHSLLQLDTPPADIDGETAGHFWRELMGDADDVIDAVKALAAASSDLNAVHPIGRWFHSIENAFASHTDPAWWQAARLVPISAFSATSLLITHRAWHGEIRVACGVAASLPTGHWLRSLASDDDLPLAGGPAFALGPTRAAAFGGHVPRPFYKLEDVRGWTNALRHEQRQPQIEQQMQDEAAMLERQDAWRRSPQGQIAELKQQITRLEALNTANMAGSEAAR